MIQLNLLPDIKLQYQKARRTQAKVIGVAVLASIISVGAVVLVALWVYGVQGIQRAHYAGSIKKNYQELSNIKDINKYVTVQNQLTTISGLHANKVILSRVFDVMGRLNPNAPNNVRISTLNVDVAATTFIMEGETASYTGLETFRDTLKNATVQYSALGSDGKTVTGAPVQEPLFTPGSVLILTEGQGKATDGSPLVAFKIQVQYNPKIFARDTTNMLISVPTKDTTASKEDTPSVFSPPAAAPAGGDR
jgi:hypothetical protein